MVYSFHAVAGAALALLLSACAAPPLAAEARLGEPALSEASGLALSRRDPDVLWLHNDGGHSATLYALAADGRPLARYKVRGERNRDWEDLASFRWRGQSWLLLADVGDNKARHKRATLHFFHEPEQPGRPAKGGKKRKLKAVFSVDFRYPDGPRDAEAVAFDPLSESVLVLSKRDTPARLYALPLAALQAEPKRTHTATALGPLPWAGQLPALGSLLADPSRLVSHGMATAMDIADDGLRAVVLGYQQAVLLRREPGQRWAEATRQPLPAHRLEQAEAIAFSADQRAVVLTSEGKNAPILRQPLP